MFTVCLQSRRRMASMKLHEAATIATGRQMRCAMVRVADGNGKALCTAAFKVYGRTGVRDAESVRASGKN